MRRIFVIVVITALSLLVFTCTNAVGVPGACFNQKIKPIILSNCTGSGCHNSQDQEAGLNLSTYEGVMRIVKPGHPLQSELYTVIRARGEGKMPPDHNLSNADIQAIKGWISMGAREDDCPTLSCDSSNYTYSGQVQPIVRNNCLGCHSSGKVILKSYGDLRAVALSGALTGSIKHNPGYRAMPEGYTLSDCEIFTISKWVESGAPNN